MTTLTKADPLLAADYRRRLTRTLEAINPADVFEMARRLRVVKQRGGTVYVIGNGGSKANAEHLVLHLRDRDIPAVDLLADGSWLTAFSNDFAYDAAPGKLLGTFNVGQPDAVFVISGSGMSQNVLGALAAAPLAMRLGLLGFGGGLAMAECHHAITLPQDSYGVVEDAHSAVVHMLHELLDPALDWR